MHTREKVVGVAIGWLLWGAVASACPFCDVVGRSLSERRDQSAVVAIGETNGTAVLRNDSVLYQPWQIMKVIRGTFQQTSEIISARVGVFRGGSHTCLCSFVRLRAPCTSPCNASPRLPAPWVMLKVKRSLR